MLVLPKPFPSCNPQATNPHPLAVRSRSRAGAGGGAGTICGSDTALKSAKPGSVTPCQHGQGGSRRGQERERAGGHSAVCCVGGEVSSSRCRPDRQDGDVDQKFATVEIPRPRLSLSLVLIKGYSTIMPQGAGFLAHNEPCVIAFVSRLGCNTDGSHSSNSDISPLSIMPDRSFAVPSRPAVPHLTVFPIIML